MILPESVDANDEQPEISEGDVEPVLEVKIV